MSPLGPDIRCPTDNHRKLIWPDLEKIVLTREDYVILATSINYPRSKQASDNPEDKVTLMRNDHYGNDMVRYPCGRVPHSMCTRCVVCVVLLLVVIKGDIIRIILGVIAKVQMMKNLVLNGFIHEHFTGKTCTNIYLII